eukprot:CAMPEP_0115042246 /NCGR_PEP_ID=MMETSP0216-20121206/46157_1 /TAXON_ID=223996 /ORGANISM="Protocruzia adherens, Strain Boccale" /LENGTH=1362 /DNA_ID=CAMNT_0002424335 /DNA_START=432 /DNA_END=4520 /DNA_ORIENTATION=-
MKATTSTTAAYLIFVDSQNIEREQYQLKHGENRIGSDPTSDVSINFASISRNHVVLEVDVANKRCRAKDLGSKDGTYLQREGGRFDTIQESDWKVVENKSVILIGEVKFRFQFEKPNSKIIIGSASSAFKSLNISASNLPTQFQATAVFSDKDYFKGTMVTKEPTATAYLGTTQLLDDQSRSPSRSPGHDGNSKLKHAGTTDTISDDEGPNKGMRKNNTIEEADDTQSDEDVSELMKGIESTARSGEKIESMGASESYGSIKFDSNFSGEKGIVRPSEMIMQDSVIPEEEAEYMESQPKSKGKREKKQEGSYKKEEPQPKKQLKASLSGMMAEEAERSASLDDLFDLERAESRVDNKLIAGSQQVGDPILFQQRKDQQKKFHDNLRKKAAVLDPNRPISLSQGDAFALTGRKEEQSEEIRFEKEEDGKKVIVLDDGGRPSPRSKQEHNAGTWLRKKDKGGDKNDSESKLDARSTQEETNDSLGRDLGKVEDEDGPPAKKENTLDFDLLDDGFAAHKGSRASSRGSKSVSRSRSPSAMVEIDDEDNSAMSEPKPEELRLVGKTRKLPLFTKTKPSRASATSKKVTTAKGRGVGKAKGTVKLAGTGKGRGRGRGKAESSGARIGKKERAIRGDTLRSEVRSDEDSVHSSDVDFIDPTQRLKDTLDYTDSDGEYIPKKGRKKGAVTRKRTFARETTNEEIEEFNEDYETPESSFNDDMLDGSASDSDEEEYGYSTDSTSKMVERERLRELRKASGKREQPTNTKGKKPLVSRVKKYSKVEVIIDSEEEKLGRTHSNQNDLEPMSIDEEEDDIPVEILEESKRLAREAESRAKSVKKPSQKAKPATRSKVAKKVTIYANDYVDDDNIEEVIKRISQEEEVKKVSSTVSSSSTPTKTRTKLTQKSQMKRLATLEKSAGSSGRKQTRRGAKKDDDLDDFADAQPKSRTRNTRSKAHLAPNDEEDVAVVLRHEDSLDSDSLVTLRGDKPKKTRGRKPAVSRSPSPSAKTTVPASPKTRSRTRNGRRKEEEDLEADLRACRAGFKTQLSVELEEGPLSRVTTSRGTRSSSKGTKASARNKKRKSEPEVSSFAVVIDDDDDTPIRQTRRATAKKPKVSHSSSTEEVAGVIAGFVDESKTPSRRGRSRVAASPVPSGDESSQRRRSTPRKSGKKSVVQILLTGIEVDHTLKAQVKKIGAEIVEGTPEGFDVLVASSAKRTIKFLYALSMGAEIVTLDWVTESAKVQEILPYADFQINDRYIERKFQFKLSEAVQKVRNNKRGFLDGYAFYCCEGCIPNKRDLELLIKSSGGDYLKAKPRTVRDNCIIIANNDDFKERKFLENLGYDVFYQEELILHGILKQDLLFKKYQFSH